MQANIRKLSLFNSYTYMMNNIVLISIQACEIYIQNLILCASKSGVTTDNAGK